MWLWDGVLSGFNYNSTEGLAEGRRVIDDLARDIVACTVSDE